MHRPFLLLTALLISMIPLAALSADPAPVAALKALGINANPVKEGGWNVDVRDAKGLSEEGWKLIEALPDLKRLSGSGESFDDAALARIAKIPSIEVLFFNGPAFTDPGLAALATMPKLQRFAVDHSGKLSGSGLAALKSARSLTALHFGGCTIGDEGVKALAQLTQLKDVSLGHVRITRASFPVLAKMPEIERIEITPNWDPAPYTAADFAAFAVMKNLRELEIHDMVLPWEDGLSHLKPIRSLKTLKLYWCYLNSADTERLKSEMPGVTVDIKNPAGEDRLKQFNERLEKIRAKPKL